MFVTQEEPLYLLIIMNIVENYLILLYFYLYLGPFFLISFPWLKVKSVFACPWSLTSTGKRKRKKKEQV